MEREDFTAPDIEPPIPLSGTARKIAERELAKGAGYYALARYLNTTVEVIAAVERAQKIAAQEKVWMKSKSKK